MFYSPRAWVADRAQYRPDDWRHAERWPPPGVRPRRLYLRGDGSLADDGPGGEPRPYRYDPRRPIPTLGGRNMLIEAGPLDQRPAQALPNYGLIYRGEALAADLTIAGNVRVTLSVQSNCPDTDFVAKLIENHAGRARDAADGRGHPRDVPRPGAASRSRSRPDRIYRLTIDLGHIHHTFGAGSRIEIDVTSSNFPRRARNTNSGNPDPGARRGDGYPRRRITPYTTARLPPRSSTLPVPAG